ncbi:MAG: LapA family protein [Brachybacterium sp.]|uniref:LapA family protein n=1 Tax=Brachybacterium sp. Z12 TaxID=2759167 RepID=UPI00185FB68E|nr:lipopolysaccharide assembly protein LapA domain-containing protein [Brachybacterium sp. Z12]QNN83019.1 DUF1049 domain-containing protein [Brachybacterium sp. Z12]
MRSSDDPIRPTGADGAGRPDSPAPESPADPEAPVTGRRAAERPQEPEPGTEAVEPVGGGGGKTAGMWIGLILGAIILVMLLIFVLQNNQTAGFQYFATEFDLPLGIAMLLAAIAGALVMALVGSVRMMQMSWTIRKLRKQQEKIHRVTR